MKDKENQIDNSWKAKMIEKGLYKDSETTSEEKQIEEIKRIIDNRCEAELGQVHASSNGGKVTKTVDTKLIAKDIYEYLTKDSVVLSREEYSALNNKLNLVSKELLTAERIQYKPYFIAEDRICKLKVEQERKETAEKIFNTLLNCHGHYSKDHAGEYSFNLYKDRRYRFISKAFIYDLAKQFGVEIKE